MHQLSYHFIEIRLRFFYIVFCLLLTLVTCYYHQLEILYILGRPFLNLDHKFILIDLTEAFYTLLRICGIFSVFLIIPFSLYHLWSFYIPSRYNFERKTLGKFSLLFFVFFFFELIILYFVIFPLVCEFLLSFEIISSNNSEFINQASISISKEMETLSLDRGISISKEMETLSLDRGMPSLITETESLLRNEKIGREGLPVVLELTARLESYVKLSTRFYSSMLLVFQIPFLVIIFYYYKIIDCFTLCKIRKFFLFSSLLVSAFISPPDIISQSLIAILLFSFYEILIIVGLFYSHFLDEIFSYSTSKKYE